MSGMFGFAGSEELDVSLVKGTYRLKLEDIKDAEAKTEYGEPERRFKIFNFSIADENEAIEDFNGENVKGLFLNYWPNLTEEEHKAMSGKDKGHVRRNFKLYTTLARAFGADEDKVEAGTVNFDDFVGSFVFGVLYMDKNKEIQVQADSIAPETSVEL